MGRRFTFRIPGPLLGYRASWVRAVAGDYRAFKEAVRLIANTVGVPEYLSPDDRARLVTLVTWRKAARIDTINVHKLLEDALWTQDRRCLEGSYNAIEYQPAEVAEVMVEIWKEKQ